MNIGMEAACYLRFTQRPLYVPKNIQVPDFSSIENMEVKGKTFVPKRKASAIKALKKPYVINISCSYILIEEKYLIIDIFT